MSPTRSRGRLPLLHATGAADEAEDHQGGLGESFHVRMGGLESPGGSGRGRGGGAGRAGDGRRRYSLGQRENVTLRRIEAQMQVSE